MGLVFNLVFIFQISQIGTALYAVKVLKLPFIIIELVMVWISDNIFIRLSAKKDEKVNDWKWT